MGDVMISPADLTASQRAAYDLLLRFGEGKTPHAMALLEGYAGTGKTTLVGLLLAALRERHPVLRLAVAAPTNKAVRVLAEKLAESGLDEGAGIEYRSIQSFLGLRVVERDDGTQECRPEADSKLHEYDLAVIDECSMIGMEIFSRIVSTKRQTMVLFVGDPAQLPPVDGKADLSPVFRHVTCRVTLTEVVRQAAGNPIIALSMLIRRYIEDGRAIDSIAIAESLPPPPAMVDVSPGGRETVIGYALYERQEEKKDARIIAFTNQRVLEYNREMHRHIYGETIWPFALGETVIAHEQFEARLVGTMPTPVTLINSEELQIVEIENRRHPMYEDIPACRLILKRDTGVIVSAYCAADQMALKRQIDFLFKEHNRFKTEADLLAKARGREEEIDAYRQKARKASSQAFGLKRAFAPLRHAYALTAHKSQGSTYDTGIVDFADLSKMRDAFQFNRALYVAATRARHHLAIVV